MDSFILCFKTTFYCYVLGVHMCSLIFLSHLCSFSDDLLVVIKSSSMGEARREETFTVPMQKGILRQRKIQ